jgi:hypothetical protein
MSSCLLLLHYTVSHNTQTAPLYISVVWRQDEDTVIHVVLHGPSIDFTCRVTHNTPSRDYDSYRSHETSTARLNER